MPTLNSVHKRWLVCELAMYGMPSQVAADFKARFSIEVTRQQAESYDAGKARHRGRMSADLVTLFDEVRAAWKAETMTIALTDKGRRLTELEAMYLDAKGKNNRRMMLQILEQIAKETGDAFTNRREITGKDGAPLPAPAVVFDLGALSEEELDVIEKLHARHAPESAGGPAREG